MKQFFLWLGKALSHNLTPSHKRLISIMFSITICYCEIYHTYKRQSLDTTHLGYFLVAILVMSGVATISQIVELVRGTSASTSQQIVKTENSTLISNVEEIKT